MDASCLRCIVMAFLALWQMLRQWLWCDSHCCAASDDDTVGESDQFNAIPLRQKRAIVYHDALQFQRFYVRASDTMNVSRYLLEGAQHVHFGKRHLQDDYVAFVTTMVDSIATNATQTEDGWSSEE